MSGATGESNQFARWQLMRIAFPTIEDLSDDSIYALPLGLTDAIVAVIPEFFSEEQQRFERQLARISGGGFFQRRQIRYPHVSSTSVSADAVGNEPCELDERLRQSDRSIREMLGDEIRSRGGDEAEVASYGASHGEAARQIALWQRGYAGWLVTNPNFQSDRDRFRAHWGRKIIEMGRFPTVPMSFMGETPSPPPIADREFFAEYMEFFRCWGLDSMASWDLPMPLRAELALPSLYSLDHLSGAGILLFIPWHALRSKELDLHDLAAKMRRLHAPVHLLPWLDGEPKNWGYERFGVMLDLYVILKLTLERRYGLRLAGNLDRLDHALGRFFCRDQVDPDGHVKMAETIRKIRQEMNRRLAPPEVE